ncbi:MAG: cytochrome ubiquinol oxidase subunit I [Ilumatobacteraceae bacterium]|nr:cytochrome ubiquinol oxidase subunit I [Ilumatobacteraceae bacterium]
MNGSLLADALLPARWQMTVSLGSHIILACFGVAFPAMIFVLHRRAIRHDDHHARELAKRWSKVAAVLFAVGAVSGTILSFEMGMLWPELMRTYGDVIGVPFALEGIAFFTEAIFLGIYLYGWGRLPDRLHLMMLVPIAIAGVVGTYCILAVNAWMNRPNGMTIVDGEIVAVQPWDVLLNGRTFLQFLHMWLAAFMVVGFLVAAVYAAGLLRGRDDRHHRLGFTVPFAFATVAAVVQPFAGHLLGGRLYEDQPAKLAAIEMAVETETRAPLVVGGILGIEIPGLGSLISRGGLDREVPGLNDFAADERPKDGLVTLVHWAFQGMVGISLALLALGIVYWWSRRRGRDLLTRRWFLWAAVLAGPGAVVALELGWIVTEVGRQPWIAQGLMRVAEAVTDSDLVWATLGVLLVVYVAMGWATVVVLRSMAARWRAGEPADLPTPYDSSDRTGALL